METDSKIYLYDAANTHDTALAALGRLYELASLNIDALFDPLFAVDRISSMRVFLVLKRDGAMSYSEIKHSIDMSDNATSGALNELLEKRIILKLYCHERRRDEYRVNPAWSRHEAAPGEELI